MDKLFLDANVLFSAAYRPDSGLLKLWKLKVELITSAYALEEALINLETDEQRGRLNRLMEKVQLILTYAERELLEDIKLPDKDRPILQAAIAANATHLLTGDITHFSKYFGKTISEMLIQPPGEYLREHSHMKIKE